MHVLVDAIVWVGKV